MQNNITFISRSKYNPDSVDDIEYDKTKYDFGGAWQTNFHGPGKGHTPSGSTNPDPFEDDHKKDDTFYKMGMDMKNKSLDYDVAVPKAPKKKKKSAMFSDLYESRKSRTNAKQFKNIKKKK